ncbi:MAG TPA: phosphopantetheine-binding protein [Myxococcales bacterium]|nr:phosphopantetheine-binding protein [Myxococcales bacterium]
MTARDRTAVLQEVARLIREVVGEAWIEDKDIGMETSFGHDLELESIEFVALGERLQTHFGKQVDFVGWLSGKELDEILGLKVGDLVEFIARCL